MPLEPGQVSYIPSMVSLDRQNSRIYAMDPGPGKSVGINLDKKTGNMTLAWSADQQTLSWMILIGPADQSSNRDQHFIECDKSGGLTIRTKGSQLCRANSVA
jgi:hypothetical protein